MVDKVTCDDAWLLHDLCKKHDKLEYEILVLMRKFTDSQVQAITEIVDETELGQYINDNFQWEPIGDPYDNQKDW